MRRLSVFFTAMMAALLVGACGSDEMLTAEQFKIKKFNESLGRYVESGEEARAAVVELARIGSRDFTISAAAASQDAPDYTPEEKEAFLNALVEMSAKVNSLVVKSHEMIKAGDDIVIRDIVDRSAAILEHGMRPRFLLTGVVALGMGAAACYGLFKAKEEISEKWSEPETKRLEEVTEGSAEHKVINESLGLDENTPKEETLKKYKGLNGLQRAQAANDISLDLAARSTESGDVRPIDSKEKSTAIVNATTAAGTAAVKLDTTLLTGVNGSVTGGKVLEWATGSETLDVTTDLLITVVTEATGLPIEPLDVFAEKVDVVVTASQTDTIEVDIPADLITSKQARKSLEDKDAEGKKQKDAAAAIVLDAADRYPQVLRPTVETDGTVTIQAPEKTFIGEFDKPSNETLVQLPALGSSSVVVTMDGKVPMSIEGVDLSGGSLGIKFEDRDIESYGEGIDKQTKLAVTVDNSKPASGEDVTIYIDCPDATEFPITLEAPTLSRASLAWGSPLERCPFTVLFNADVAGEYQLAFTVTDAEKNDYKGTTTIRVSSGEETVQNTDGGDDGAAFE